MDSFCEQLIVMRKKPLQYLAILGYWLAAAALSAVAFFFVAYLGIISIVLTVGFFYGAYKLSTLFNVEYEYIVTNGTVDIDKITNRFSRKRVLSFELSTVTKLEKFNAASPRSGDRKNTVYACNTNDPNAYLLMCNKESKGNFSLIFAPNEKVQRMLIKFLPKYIGNSAFK